MKIIYSLFFVATASFSQCMDGAVLVDRQEKTCESSSSSSSKKSNKTNEAYISIPFDLESFLKNPSVTVEGKKYPICMSTMLITLLGNKESGIEEQLKNAIDDIILSGVSEMVSHIELLLIDNEISIQPVRKKW